MRPSAGEARPLRGLVVATAVFLMLVASDPELASSAIRLSVPLLFLAVGEYVSQRTGVLNVGLEGMFLVGAYGCAAGGSSSGSLLVGIAAGTLAAAAFALVTGVLVTRFGADQIVVGLAMNILALGLTVYLVRSIWPVDTLAIPELPTLDLPLLSSIPLVGEALFSQRLLTYGLIVIVVAVGWTMNHTAWGLHARACGDNASAVDATGWSVTAIRLQAILFTGAMAGLASSYVVLAETRSFSEGMSGGRGFLAIAAVICGGWRLRGAVLAALVIGGSIALQFELPAIGVSVPTQALLALPYVVALLAVIVLPRGGAGPPMLLRPFRRGTP